VASTTSLNGIVKEFGLLDFPFLFANAKQADALVDGPLGKMLTSKLPEKGVIVLGFFDLGFRNVTNSKRPIMKGADLEGLKLRVIPNPVFLETFKTFKANPVPMPFAELYGALESKAVDGEENPFAVIASSKFYEVQKYVSGTNHVYATNPIQISKRFWDKLSATEHKILRDAELLVSPRVAMERGLLAGSGRSERRIGYDRNFLISTCPSTKTGQAKVQPDGVKINYLYYSCPTLRLAFGKKVPVRFDPTDMSTAFALVEGKWLELTSRFANTLKGRTERELQLARDEYFRHRSMVEKTRLTERTFVNFLEYLDKTEEMLIDHHRAIEMRRAAGNVDDAAPEESDDDSDGEVTSCTATPKPVPLSPFALAAMDLEPLEVE
jgi:hypothetical protein